uniref:Putative basic tail protein n=1 Tax=Ixodes ricinus TaxID=34613 RepID=A0A0K8R8L5_IXORI
MPTSRLLIVTIACLAGQITCDELDPNLKRCEDKAFNDPGYSPRCAYTCRNGLLADETEYWGIYKDATVCVVLQNGDPNKFQHVGTCKNGICVQYEGPNTQQVWSQLPELQDQFHECDTISSGDSVENCLFVCKKYQYPYEKEGYFYGVYKDGNKCKLENGEVGVCFSGFCHGKEYFPTIDNGPLKPS